VCLQCSYYCLFYESNVMFAKLLYLILVSFPYMSLITRDVTDSESDGIRQFFRNPKSDRYLKSDRDGVEILVSVQLKCYFRK